MFERIFACLFRLYPSRFRKVYGNEARWLIRDRMRDERGWRRARLAFDLLTDFAQSAPRVHWKERMEAAARAVPGSAGRAPLFQTLEEERIQPQTVVVAGLVASSMLATLGFLMSRPGAYRGEGGGGSASPSSWAASQGNSGMPQGQSNFGEIGPHSSQATQRAGTDKGSVLMALPADERRLVIDGVSTNLREHYFDRSEGRKIAGVIQSHAQHGDYNSMTGETLAGTLTRQMQAASHDPDLEVVYSASRLPFGPPPGVEDRYRAAMQQSNCTFEKVEMLAHNIGYLKLNSFPDPAVCQSTAVAAMAQLQGADAVIFDLRDNGGGYAGMVALLAGYLFKRPTALYDPRGEPDWAHPVVGNRLADKPVYVLTSRRTISAAEQFSYNLKMLRRATLVGERTAGSAHAGVFHRIDDHFGIGIPEVQARNPYGTGSWEGVGVEPDVNVKAIDALTTAVKLAETRLQKK
jgi:Peptidase family S41/N-terminal domain of Peptidase_S41 in eukaryotic IRBP